MAMLPSTNEERESWTIAKPTFAPHELRTPLASMLLMPTLMRCRERGGRELASLHDTRQPVSISQRPTPPPEHRLSSMSTLWLLKRMRRCHAQFSLLLIHHRAPRAPAICV